MSTVKKTYKDLPAAHRQPNHDGHCRLIHGHNWEISVTFASDETDECCFIVDVGKLGFIKKYLESLFDHTLILNSNDPLLQSAGEFLRSHSEVRTVPDCSMEGLAKYLCIRLDSLLDSEPGMKHAREVRKLRVISVRVAEDSKNESESSHGAAAAWWTSLTTPTML